MTSVTSEAVTGEVAAIAFVYDPISVEFCHTVILMVMSPPRSVTSTVPYWSLALDSTMS
jgi:hypothetical protein